MATHKRARSYDEPEIAYSECMGMKMTPQWDVATCPLPVFRELIEISTLTAKNTETCAKQLQGLDFREMVDRWFSLLVLMEAGADIPRFLIEEYA